MQPFDPLAPTYDADFTQSPIARYLRGRVHRRLDALFQPGDYALELGCGTGEDALYLASRGVRVLATDASDAMLDAARAKTRHSPLVTVAKLDLTDLPPHPLPLSHASGERGDREHSEVPRPEGEGFRVRAGFSGVFSNFGLLNCLDSWQSLAAWLAARITSGGVAAFGVMSPLCLWEMGWHGAHGDFKTAFRRLRRDTHFNGLPIRYPSIRRLTRDFAPYFRRVHVEALGLFLPPSDVYGVLEARPRLLRPLLALERRFGHLAPLLADHYWIEFRRV
jgi:SAM-dependent methyltransferase